MNLQQYDIVGKSLETQGILDFISQASKTQENILILGECGTGKERIARSIHTQSQRATAPFVMIYCSDLSEALSHKDFVHEVRNGTLFLNNMEEFHISILPELITLLPHVRVIASFQTQNKRDAKRFEGMKFTSLFVPPLRERKEDIPLLANYFLKKYSKIYHSKVEGFSHSAIATLVRSEWTGNVRELEATIERAVILSSGTLIEKKELRFVETPLVPEFFLIQNYSTTSDAVF